MTSNALVLMWQGNSLQNDNVIEAIANVLVTSGVCDAEHLVVTYKDNDGVISSLIENTPHKNNRCVSNSEAVKNAVTYIGERFATTLSDHDLIKFAIDISIAAQSATKNLVRSESEIALLNAMRIISELPSNYVIAPSLVRKYYFVKNVVEIIKKVSRQ